jgi:hypothetical protein
MVHRLPWLKETTPANASVPAGFIMCPPALMATWNGGVCPWQAIYAEAMERAQRVVRPSRLERLYREQPN